MNEKERTKIGNEIAHSVMTDNVDCAELKKYYTFVWNALKCQTQVHTPQYIRSFEIEKERGIIVEKWCVGRLTSDFIQLFGYHLKLIGCLLLLNSYKKDIFLKY